MADYKVRSCALFTGFVWSVVIFVLGMVSARRQQRKVVDFISLAYRGYKPGFCGSIIGAIWAFADGAIFGAFCAKLMKIFCRKQEGRPPSEME